MALLHATACRVHALAQSQDSVSGPTQVLALHVHHGLSPHADRWLAHVQAQCEQWAQAGLPVTMVSCRLAGAPAPGESIEAWARDGRYRALADMARSAGADRVLLAHHRQDQAETFVLQAMRGAGVAGLSGMPHEIVRDGITWVRPWLDQPREAIEAHVAAHGLSHIDDDSNTNERFARNRWRLSVWPGLQALFPQAEQGFADAAHHQADAQACMQEWVDAKWPTLTTEQGGTTAMSLAAWQALGDSAQRVFLKIWTERVAGIVLPQAVLCRLQRDWVGRSLTGGARWPLHGWREVVLYRGWLSWRKTARSSVEPVPEDEPAPRLPVTDAGNGLHQLALGWGRVQVDAATDDQGLPRAVLARAHWRQREGGEHFQLGAGRPQRLLRKQYQAEGVPAWAREGPLLWLGDVLLFVPGLGLDAKARALPGDDRVVLSWSP